MSTRQGVSGVVKGSVAAVTALVLFASPRRRKNVWLKRGMKFWKKGSRMMMKSKFFH